MGNGNHPTVPQLLVGYLPERVRATEAAVQVASASEADVLRIGGLSPLRLQDVRAAIKFCTSFPVDSQSNYRTAVLDLTSCPLSVQHALLKFVEEPPAVACIILTASEIHYVLPTIQSRCRVEIFQPPSVGGLLRDLSQRGMSMSSAASTAKQIQYGFGLENVPDDSARGRAAGFLDAVKPNRLDLALKQAGDFDVRTVHALRQRLISDRLINALVASYTVTSPQGVGVVVIPHLKGYK